MEIAKRIIALIEILGLTPAEFADKISVQRSGISHITSGRNKPSLDFLERTMSVFPDINSEWLILGKGRPLKSQTETLSQTKKMDDMNGYSPLLFPVENLDEGKDTNIKNTEAEIEKVNEAVEEKIIEEDKSSFNETVKKDSKKEIKKVLVLYTDGSFDSFEN